MVRNRTLLAGFAAIAVGVAIVPERADAGFIDLGKSGWRAEWPDSQDAIVSIVVDSENATSVRIQKFIQFQPPPAPGLPIAPVDVVFTQTRVGAVPNIIIEDEVITNQTGITWTDFHMQLIDSGDARWNVAATAVSGGPAPIGFSIAPFTNAVFSGGVSGPDTVLDIFGGGVVLPNQTWFPGAGANGDGSLWILATPHAQAPFTVFTLKEFPTVPEPTVVGLCLLPALAMLRRRTTV